MNNVVYLIVKKGIIMREAYASLETAFIFMVDKYLEDTHVSDDKERLLKELTETWQMDDEYTCLGDTELHKIFIK